MPDGSVKWFGATKGFGFIQPKSGLRDVFVKIRAIERAGVANLPDGQKVSYDLERGREAATNLTLVD